MERKPCLMWGLILAFHLTAAVAASRGAASGACPASSSPSSSLGDGDSAACTAPSPAVALVAPSARDALLSEFKEEDGASTSAAFIQRALEYRAKELRLAGEKQAAAKVDAVAKNLSSQALHWRPCVDTDLDGTLPFSLRARLDFEVLSALGLGPSQRLELCRLTSWGNASTDASFGGLRMHGASTVRNASVEELMLLSQPFSVGNEISISERNNLTGMMILVLGVIATFLIAWSLYSVLIVPAKLSRPQIKDKLANEAVAWRSGFLSWVNLSWADDLMGRYGKNITSVVSEEEVAPIRESGAFDGTSIFREAWKQEIAKNGAANASLVRAIFKVIGFKGCFAMFFAMTIDQVSQTILMVVVVEKNINYLMQMQSYKEAHPGAQQSLLEPTLLVLAVSFSIPMLFRAAAIVSRLTDGHYTQRCTTALASAIFEKTMALPAGSTPAQDQHDDPDPSKSCTPNVVQLYNVDVMGCWEGLLPSVINLILLPCLLVIQFGMLISRIHTAGVIGFLYAIPVFFGSVIVGQVFSGLFRNQQMYQDMRLKKFTDTVAHIRTLKSLALEATALEQLESARRWELNFAQKCVMCAGVTISLAQSLPWGSALLALWYLLKTQGAITVVQIVVVQRLMFGMLATIGGMTGCIQKCLYIPVSMDRVKRYLIQEERPAQHRLPPPPPPPASGDDAPEEPPVLALKGSFSFLQNQKPVLQNLDLTIRRGELVAVIGGVASGKSALLQAFLGELFPVGEDSAVLSPEGGSNKLAYCSQVPWIFEGTLRENVVMQAPFDQKKYFQALHVAALTPDLETMPGADMVMIGSHGIRLSGGQRARVALARAAYFDQSEVVLIDDPFASVDVSTSAHLLENLVLGPCMEGRTRVIAMQPCASRLRHFDRVVMIEEGVVTAAGSPDEVLNSAAFRRLLEQEHGDESASQASGSEPSGGGARAASAALGSEAAASVCRRKGGETDVALRESEDQDHITLKTVFWWMKVAGYKNLSFFLGMVLINRFLDTMQAVWMSAWMDAKTTHAADDSSIDHAFMIKILLRTMVLSGTIIVTSYASSRLAITASSAIHTQIVSTILRAPIDKFFDKQPIGRLINRLSTDMKTSDDAVPFCFQMLFGFCCSFVMTEGVVFRQLPWGIIFLALPFAMTGLVFVYIFRGTCVALIFANKFAMSRVHDIQAVCVTSNVSIRANGMRQEFVNKFNEHSEMVVRTNYLSVYVCVAWMQSRIFFCMSVMGTIMALYGIHAGLPIGTLSLIFAMSNTVLGLFESFSGILTHALNVGNALQRLARYLDIPQESASTLPSDPVIRVCVQVENLVRMDIREMGKAWPKAVFISGQAAPLLAADAVGKALVLQEGRLLEELAPGCEALVGKQGVFYISAVNGVTEDSARMADELCRSQGTCWLECWSEGFAGGIGVSFEKLTAGYNTEKAVLQSLTFSIPPRVKCGIVGSTGCGKSTTLLCLLRILEARSGRILVGSLDISKIGLKLLRNIVGLVPQDATIFEGTWRRNIDPFDEYPEGRVWTALRCAHLMGTVRALPDGIDSKITADGNNLSFGQKQLLSLARMVIRQPPVLLLDECTSALDPVTQRNVQNTVLSAFPISTVVSIAHRVETLLEFDQIVVLDKGTVAEIGSTQEVLSIKDGRFAGMVKGVTR